MNISPSNLLKLAFLGSFLSLASCATLYDKNGNIPGLDRIFNYFSKAQVGPVKKADGEIVPGTQTSDTEAAIEAKETDKTNNHHNSSNHSASAKTEQPTATQHNADTKANQPNTASESKPAHKHVSKPKVKSKPLPKISNSKITGQVTLLAKDGQVSPEGVIVRLNRLDGLAIQKPTAHATHKMDMVDKSYSPGNIVIQKGDTLNFVNSDLIQHNVFSSTGENAFDLGTFGGGYQREVTLNEDGVVKVYCNIHKGMAAFVAVDDKGVSKVIDSEDGSFKFSNLPAGEYQLTLWSVRGEQTQHVTLPSNKVLNLDLTFDTSNFKPTEHVNKFGKTYPNKRVYREFY